MTNTNTFIASFLRALTVSFLFVGIALITAAHGSTFLADMTGGSFLAAGMQYAPVPTNFHTAAMVYQESITRTQVLIGMALILGGFFAHALYVVRYQKHGHKKGIQM